MIEPRLYETSGFEIMKMNTEKPDGDSDSDDTITSNGCSESSGEESDHGEISDSESISLSVVSTTSTVTSTKPPNPNKKRVSFKPGDSLVLVYEIPNRAMLGLKSDSESSDEGDGEESDDEDDDDDSDTDDEDDSSDEEEKDDSKTKSQKRNTKSLPKLLSVKSISRRNNVECNADIKRDSRKVAKLIGLSLNHTQQPPTQRRRMRGRIRSESGENDKTIKKEPHPKTIMVDEVKRKKTNTRMSKGLNAISNQTVQSRGGRRRRNRHFLEIKATLPHRKETTNSNNLGVTRYKHDLKPSIATLDSHGAISVCGKQTSQTLTQRSRLQPVSFRLAKTRLTHGSVYSSMASSEKDKHTPDVKQALPATYETFQSLKRLDPDNMNSKNKRNYAWQVANGTISSHQLRTPSILPFWDSLQNSMIADKNGFKLPT